MRIYTPIVFFVALGLGACGDGEGPAATTYIIQPATLWFTTAPDVDLSPYSSAVIHVTFSNDHASDSFLFDAPPQFQIWSVPGGHDFMGAAEVTANVEPSGTVAPGGMFSYELTVDLTGMPSGQRAIAFRPKDTNFGTIGPDNAGVVASDVTFTP